MHVVHWLKNTNVNPSYFAWVLNRFSHVWLYNPIDCSHAPSPQAPLCSSGILQARMLEWLSCPPPLDSPPRDGNSISRGSCIAGRFFTAEPPGKAPQLMCRMANSYLFYFTIFDTYLFSIPFVGNCLLNSLKSGFAFITSPRSSSFIQM